MKTKEFNSVLQNVPYNDQTSGFHKDVEILAGTHIVTFSLDCDIEVKYYSSATYMNPEEYELKQTKCVSNIKVCSEDYEIEYTLNKQQEHKLAQEIEENINVVY